MSKSPAQIRTELIFSLVDRIIDQSGQFKQGGKQLQKTLIHYLNKDHLLSKDLELVYRVVVAEEDL